MQWGAKEGHTVGLTDHIWTTEELLAYRVPVEFLDQLRTIEHLFLEWNGVHHSN